MITEEMLSNTEWGNDPLTKYIKDANYNSIVAFLKRPAQYTQAIETGKLFHQLLQDLDKVGQSDIHASFICRALSNYVAAIRLVTGGQLSESFCLSRSCLENALYSVHIRANPDLKAVWMERESSAEGLVELRNKFTNQAVKASLRSRNLELAERLDKFYERCIAFGGHPNVLSHSINQNYDEVSNTTILDIINVDPEILPMAFYLNCMAGRLAIHMFIDSCGGYLDSVRWIASLSEIAKLFSENNKVSE